MNWRYIVDRGITCADKNISMFYGMDRDELRRLLHYTQHKNKGRFSNEDSYENILDSEDFIRPGFNDIQKLSEIEVLKGEVNVEGIRIIIMGELDTVLSAFANKGYSFVEGDYSFTCSELKIDIGDSKKNGGINNKVYWFYTSKDFNLNG